MMSSMTVGESAAKDGGERPPISILKNPNLPSLLVYRRLGHSTLAAYLQIVIAASLQHFIRVVAQNCKKSATFLNINA
jgi:hypothetical protein